MILHLGSVLRVSAVFGLALLALPLLRQASAVARRLVLSAAFAAVLLVPCVPAWHLPTPAVGALAARLVMDRTVAGTAVPTPLPSDLSIVAPEVEGFTLVWAIGGLVVATRFALGLVLASRLARRAVRVTGWEPAVSQATQITGIRVTVRGSAEVEAPAVTGLFRPVVLVPDSSAGWRDERKLAVLLHELAHVAAHDLAVQVIVAIACSLHWFNPLAWLAARRLRLERELAADEAVLRAGVRASSYAEDLLSIAGAAPAGTLAIADNPLARRVAAIVARRRPSPLGAKRACAVVLGTATVALGVACATTGKPSASVTTSATASATASPSMDRELSEVAEQALAEAVSEWKAKGGTILVMSPKGEVLADVGGRTDEPVIAGSTMKTILLAAAIDEGRVSESDVFDCSNAKIAGVRDAAPLGRVALPEMFAVSSNVGFVQVFDRLGGARLDRVLRRFHFTPPPELSTEPAGDAEGALAAIGASMTATPRQVALAYAALADGGDGVVKAETAARVASLLEGVVRSDHGTGKLAQVPGARVAGKTGTSEWTAPDGTSKTYASFVGYVPADHPRYVIFVGIDSAASPDARGGTVAAPVFARVAAHALTR